VGNLVEWPEAVTGSFDPRYLKLPRPVVVTAMRAHQRYFAVEGKDGALLPNFVMIRSGRGAGAEEIRRGTEAVLKARLEDARFYWENDLKRGLEAKLPELKGIVWNERLGTVHDRAQRMVLTVEDLASRLAPGSREHAKRAALLAKADLASEMVRSGKEFASLQGVVGAEYAAVAGEPSAVVEAIREHYRPEGPSDPIPGTPEGRLVALADKLEAVAGGLRAGLEVTGSQDPYGLRRAGNGIVRILVESGWRLDVIDAARRVDAVFDKAGIPKGADGRFEEFWGQRVSSALGDYGIPVETAAAVIAVRPGDPVDLLARGARRRRDPPVARLRGPHDRLPTCCQHLEVGPRPRTFRLRGSPWPSEPRPSGIARRRTSTSRPRWPARPWRPISRGLLPTTPPSYGTSSAYAPASTGSSTALWSWWTIRRFEGAAWGCSKRYAKPSSESPTSPCCQALQVKNPFDISGFLTYTGWAKGTK
jgi:hypothetical protein